MRKIILKILSVLMNWNIRFYMFLNKEKNIDNKSWYTNGQLKKIIFNDKSFKEYYEDGTLQYEKDSNGYIKSYFFDGQLEQEKDIKGNSKNYNMEGELVYEVINGQTIYYYKDGTVKKKDNGVVIEEFYQNGNKKYVPNFIYIYFDTLGNKLEGNLKHYYYSETTEPAIFGPGCIPPEDVVISENNYRNGLLHGLQKYWGEFGDYLESEIEYVFGVKHGVEKRYNESGLLVSLTNYKNGDLCGLSQSWYDNGQLESEFFYGDASYPERYWFENGQLSYEKVGNELKEWDENGDLLCDEK